MPSPFIVTKDGCHFEVKVDAHYISDDEVETVRRYIATLKAENAKLRELVRDMYKAFMHGNCYRWCEFKEPCNYISDGKCQWYERMKELGVEVDE